MAGNIDNLLHETRRFEPSETFRANAVASADLYDQAASDRPAFWGDQARELLHWHTPFTTTLNWSNPPFAQWFEDGELNVAYNCLDRHVLAGNGDRIALNWEGEPGDSATYTYAQLTAAVKQAANMLLDLGIGRGDRVAIYLPMIPEAIISMLAVARIGAVHSVVFGGFSAESLRARIDDASAKLVITADGGWRKGKVSALKPAVDASLTLGGPDNVSTVEHVLVVQRGNNDIAWEHGRDLWWHEQIATAATEHEAQPFPAETPLFILYTSGTTGKPKGILHTSGGYLTQAAFTHKNVFDLHPETDVYWSTADVGWITGHTYVVYGPLANGATEVIYEGTPDSPHPGRWWEIVQKYGVTILYAAPTAIRTFMKLGRHIPDQFDLTSLRLLGSVGEPINPEAWVWYRDVIGGGSTPIVDTWWQTETGGIMISALPGVTTLKPGSAQVALPGIHIEVLDDQGEPVGKNSGGLLVVAEPWPAMLRGIWGDPDRFVETYWSTFEGKYFAGDGARLDRDGDVWLLGRVDDVMNVSGHRLSTAEIESSLVSHPRVAEAAVVGASDETTGQAVVAFVIVRADEPADTPAGSSTRDEAGSGTGGSGETDTGSGSGTGSDSSAGAIVTEPGQVDTEALSAELRAHVATQIGAIARPRQVFIVAELPKTRSGKIMRRLLRDVAEGREIGDTTTLADTQVMSVISGTVG